jgi:threonine-phosphate decarboxylase
MIIGHGGNIYDVAERLGCLPSDILDMSSNLNPLGPPPGLSEHLKGSMDTILSLPPVNSRKITSMLADRYGIPHECVLAGNGTTQFIYSIPRALGSRKALVVGPTYSDYRDACAMHRVDCNTFVTDEAHGFKPDMGRLREAVSRADTVFICNPNNPTGVLWDKSELENLCRSNAETFFIIDESYLPFVRDSYMESAVHFRLPNVLVLNSMSKVFRIPGLRVGFLIAPLAIIYRFESLILPWSVNSLAQAAVEYLLGNRRVSDEFLERTRAFVAEEKKRFVESVNRDAPVEIYGGSTYFVLAKLNGTMTAADLYSALLEQRILIRDCSNFIGLDNRFVRFSLKDKESNRILCACLNEIGERNRA